VAPKAFYIVAWLMPANMEVVFKHSILRVIIGHIGQKIIERQGSGQ
jgi:hypothetical protein